MATKWDIVTTYATFNRAQWTLVLTHLSTFPEAAQRIQETLDATPDDIVSVPASRAGWRKVKGLIADDERLGDVGKILGWQLYVASTPDW